jgi:hypothetical protein
MKPKTNDEIRQGLDKIANELETPTEPEMKPYYAEYFKKNHPQLFKESGIAKGKVR